MSDCLFCKILAGEIPSDKVYEDDKVYVFKDIYPKADVHLLMIPREHVDSLNEIDESRHYYLVSVSCIMTSRDSIFSFKICFYFIF